NGAGVPLGPSDGGSGQDQASLLGAPCQCVFQDPDGVYLHDPCLNPHTGCAGGYLCGLTRGNTNACMPLCGFGTDGGSHCPIGYTCRGGIIAGNDEPKTACEPSQ